MQSSLGRCWSRLTWASPRFASHSWVLTAKRLGSRGGCAGLALIVQNVTAIDVSGCDLRITIQRAGEGVFGLVQVPVVFVDVAS